MTIAIARGTNISHWLSQSDKRGDARAAWFTRDDVLRIAEWGFDHIRLPIDEEQLWDEHGRQEAAAWDLLDAGLDWALAAGLNVVVDLHILRNHSFGQADEPALFREPAEAERFIGLWRQLSARMHSRPCNRVAYELLNEAVATDPADWNRVALGAHAAIRALEPERQLILGSNRWNSVFTYDQLQVPDDRRTILTFHYYHPMFITHHRASWSPEGRMYDGPIRYPGRPIADEHLHLVRRNESHRLVDLDLALLNKPYDRAQLLADLAQPLAAAQRSGLPLYCGEFGVIKLAPWPVREAWYRDIVGVFTEHGIGWANWDYKGSFALVEPDGSSSGVAEAMLDAAAAKS